MDNNCILVNEADNVLVAVCALRAGDTARCAGEAVCVSGGVPVYHKLARRDIAAGEAVIKYGQTIGRATRSIAAGEHVHTQNVVSVRQFF